MKIEIACGTVIRGDVETVFNYLLKCDTWPSVEQVMAETGVRPRWHAEHALGVIKQQMRFAENRKCHLKDILD